MRFVRFTHSLNLMFCKAFPVFGYWRRSLTIVIGLGLATVSLQAKTCILTGNVSASNNPFSTCPAGADTIIVRDTLVMDQDYTSGFNGVLIVESGAIRWDVNAVLTLGHDAKLILLEGATLALGAGVPCNAQKVIVFLSNPDAKKVAVCSNGLGADTFTFEDVNATGCLTIDGLCCSVSIIAKDNSGKFSDGAICALGDSVVLLANPSGQLPYTYIWNPVVGDSVGPYTIFPAVTTTYSLSLKTTFNPSGPIDALSLQCSTSKTIVVNTPIVLTAVVTPVFCAKDSTGAIDLTVAGGTAPYTYQWSNQATTQDLVKLGAGTYTVTVSDIYGCSASTSVKVFVVDNVPPLIFCPSNKVVSPAPGTCSALVGGLDPTIIENCPNPTLTYSLSGATTGSGTGVLTNTVLFQTGTTTAVYTVTDGAFTFSCSFKVQVIDNEWPVANNPDTLHLQCLSEVPAPNPAIVQASDNCPPVQVTFLSATSSGTGCIQSPLVIRRVYKVSDNAGNSLTVVHVIRVVDTTAPVFSNIPPNTTVDCAFIPLPIAPAVADNCSQNPAVVFQESSTQTNNGTCTDREYTLTRTWTAQDACGNLATATQLITVQDNKAPVIKGVPANTTVSCGSIPTPAVLTATDNCDPTPAMSFSQSSTQTNTGACTDQSYTITRIWTATDFCGNSTSAVQTLTVQDVQAPVLSNVPASVTVECNNLPAAGTPTAIDNCDPTPTIVFTQTSTQTNNGSCSDQQYTLTRSWTATDNCGNSSVRTQVITVRDTQAPVLSNIPLNVTVSCTTIPGSALPNATDNCDPLLSITFNQSSTQTNTGICSDYSYFITRTWSVADNCGNTASKSQLITVVDNQAPVFSGIPANITVQCNNVPAPAAPLATDNCDPAPGITFSQSSTQSNNGSCSDQNYTLTRTWTAVDKCGNSRVSSQLIVVQDTQAPALSGVPASLTVNCNAIPAPASPLVTDNCDATPSLIFSEQSTAGTCSGQQFTITRNWVATDNCGNVVTATQVISVEDTQAPVLNGVPANVTVACGAIPAVATPTVLDNCDPLPVLVFNQSSTQTNTGACSDQNYILLRSWTATDRCGNVTTSTQSITVQDTQAPVFSNIPGNLTLECAAVLPPANPVAIDNCDNSPFLSYAELSTQTANGTCSDQSYTVTRTWVATDNCGNSNVLTQVLSIQDTQAPALSNVPGNITVSCAAVPPPATPTASDGCDATPAIMFAETSTQTSNGSCSDQNFVLTRVWTASDNCGNSTSKTQLITVRDQEAPVLSNTPANLTLQCNQPLPVVINPFVTDNCDATPSISFTQTSTQTANGSCSDQQYTVTRTWTATDNCGNSTQVSQSIAVQDTQAPVFSNVPGNLTVDCAAIPAPPTPVATDQCDPAPAITFSQISSQTSTGACSDQNYTLTRVWTATDRCGNAVSTTQVIVVEDLLPPVFSDVPASVTLQCDQPPPLPVTPLVSDNCDATPTIVLTQNSTQSNTGDCTTQQYTITRVWTASDNCGHTSSAVQTITVQDTQAPVITGVPANSTVECGNVPPPANPLVQDNCDTAPVLSFSEISNPTGTGCIGQNYTITRTWTAADHCGNSTSATQIISLKDTQPPVFSTVPAALTVQCDTPLPPVQNPVASDNCDNNPDVTFSETSTQTNSGLCSDVAYTILRSWTAVDDCGNASTVSQTISVVDLQAPVFTAVPAHVTLSCEQPLPAPGAVTATDNCNPLPAITFAESSTQTNNGSCSDVNYVVTRFWTATDRCGNTATATQSISLQDMTPPVLSGVPADASVSCDAIPTPATPVLSDNCDPAPSLSFQEQSSAGNCSAQSYTLTRRWIATDRCGNSSSAIQVVTVLDTEAPVFSNLPANINLACNQPVPGAPVVTITDNCDPAPNLSFAESSDQTHSGACTDLNYTITRSWTATDHCGNVSTAIQIIVVADTEAPVFANVPVNLTIACGTAVPPVSSAAVTDNCDPAPALSFTETSTQTNNGSCSDLNYSVIRTWTASDLCGNMAVTTQFIQVQDLEAPVFANVPAHITLECGEPVPPLTSPAISDNCDPTPDLSLQELSTQTSNGSCDDYSYTITRVWTATDKCGNAATTTQILVVQDHEAPVFAGVPANATVSCGQTLPNDQPGAASDNCDPAPVVAYSETSTQTNNGTCTDFSYTLTRYWTATDKCGNSSVVSQLVVIQDVQAPVLSGVPANLSVNCTSVPAPATPSVSDDCDSAPGLVFSELSTQSANGSCTDFNYTISRTWVATDRCGNSTQGLQVIFVVDAAAPVFTNVPANITTDCGAIPALATPSAADNCDPAPVLSFTEQNNIGDCSAQAYTITRTWTAADHCGNSTVVLQTIVVEDHLAPVLSNVPADQSFECDAVNIPPPATPTVSDNCDDTPSLVFSEVSSQGTSDICSSQQYTITRTWTASDDCGNVGTAVQVISILDTQKPVFELAPANITIACDEALPPSAGQVIATDNCDPEPGIAFSSGSTQTNNGTCTDYSYEITRSWTATDNCGNATSVSQQIIVSDTEAPAFSSIPGNLTLECSDPLPSPGSVTATDNCDPAPAISFSEISTQTSNGTCSDANYVLTRSWLASDACGNTSILTQTITVRDVQGPVFGGVPPPLTLDCSQPLPAVQPASVTDNCDTNPSVTLSETSTQTSNGTCTDFNYSITRRWTAVDRCGNTGTAEQLITIKDTQKPVFSIVPPNLTLQCGEPVPTVPANAVTDNCDPAPVLSFNEISTQTSNGTCSDLSYTVTRTWIATDRCGNSNTVTQVISVEDQEAPVFGNIPGDVTVECGDVPAPPTPQVTDNCDNAPAVTFTDLSNQTFNGLCTDQNYTITRTWTATDLCGNATTATQLIEVKDTQAPVLSGVPASLSVECGFVPLPASPVAVDNCNLSPSITFSQSSTQTNNGSCSDLSYTVTRTWVASDNCGNTSAAVQVITVADTTPPVLSGVPANTTLDCSFIPPPEVLDVIDICDFSPVLSFSETSTQTNNGTCTDQNYEITRTWVATDRCGNSSSGVQVISILDFTPPVISNIPADGTVPCDAVPAPAIPQVADNCDSTPILTFSENTGAGSCSDQNYTITRTWTAVDNCGNIAQVTQTLTVEDSVAPELQDVPDNVTVSCSQIPAPTSPGATDNCDPAPEVTLEEQSTQTSDGSCTDLSYTLVRTWKALDNCGNEALATQIIFVEDTEAPVFQGLAAELTVECSDVPPVPNPLVTDNCDPAAVISFEENSTQTQTGACTDHNYSLTRIWMASDRCGNNTTFVQTITVQDTQPPQIACPAGLTVHTLNGDTTASGLNLTALVTDNCGLQDISYVLSGATLGTSPANGQHDASTETFQIGLTTLIYTASDACGNQQTCSGTVSVSYTPPDVHPVFVAETDLNACNQTVAIDITAIDFKALGTVQFSIGWDPALLKFDSVSAFHPDLQLSAANFGLGSSGSGRISFSWTSPTPVFGSNIPDGALVFRLYFSNQGTIGNSGSISFGDVPLARQLKNGVGTLVPGNYIDGQIQLNDNLGPELSCPPDTTVLALAYFCTTQYTPPPVQAVDYCSGISSIGSDHPDSEYPAGTTLVTYTATDALGNSSTCVMRVTVLEPIPPQFFNCPGSLSVTIPGIVCGRIVSWPPPTATDDCNPNDLVFDQNYFPGDTFPVGVTTVIYTATDISGNTAYCSFTVTVKENKPPAFTLCPVDVVVAAAPDTCGANTGWLVPVATDKCDPDVAVSSNIPPGQFLPLGQTQVMFTAMDDSGNTAECSFTITVVDSTAPTLVCPMPVNLFVAPGGGPVTGLDLGAVFSDNCSMQDVSYVLSGATNGSSPQSGQFDASNAAFQPGNTVVSYLATDNAGNSSTCSTTVSIQTAGPTDLVLVAGSDTSHCDQYFEIDVSCLHFKDLGSVQWSMRWDPQVLQLDSVGQYNTTLPIDGSNFALNQSTDGNLVFNWISPDPVAGSSLPDGSLLFRLYFSNLAGYGAFSGIQFSDLPVVREILTPDGNPVTTVFIAGTASLSDQEPPIATCPPDISVMASGSECEAVYALPIPTIVDLCSGIGALASDFSGDVFPVGQTTVTYIVLDNSGNSATCSVQVSVMETIPPVLFNCPPNQVQYVPATACELAVSWLSPLATDACSQDTVLLSADTAPGTLLGIGAHTVTFTATDISGNSATCSFEIMVQDSIAPSIANCPPDMAVDLGLAACTAMVQWTAPIAFDNCGAQAVALSSNFPSGHSFPAGNTLVEYLATDASGNTATCGFVVQVNETVPPTLDICPGNQLIPLPLTACDTVVNWTEPGATDNCSAATVSGTAIPGDTFGPGVQTVTYTATDAAGNTSTCSFSITVIDLVPPVLSACPKDTVFASGGNCGVAYAWQMPVATDNCTADPLVLSSVSPGDTFLVGQTLVLVIAEDAFGNADTCQFEVKINGIGAGLNNVPANLSFTGCEAVAFWAPPVPVGFCGPATLLGTASPGDTFPTGVTVVEYTATDNAGNFATATFTISVLENKPPVLNCPASPIRITLAGEVLQDPDQFIEVAEPDAGCTSLEVGFTPPLASDNCGKPVVNLISGGGPGSLLSLGNHTLLYRASDASGNNSDCKIDIQIVPLSPVSITVDRPVACAGDTVTLSATMLPGATYTWLGPLVSMTGSNTLQVVFNSSLNTGYYYLQATINGCPAPVDSALVQLAIQPEAFDDLDVVAEPGQLLTFNVLLNDVYLAGDVQVAAVSSLDGLTPGINGNFSYLAGPGNGTVSFNYRLCSAACPDLCDLASVSIRIRDSICSYVPNVITPNGDGVNDYFEIPCLDSGAYPDNQLTIYNQWGDKVFEAVSYANTPDKAWQGTLHGEAGKNVPDGTYFYFFKPEPDGKVLSGYIEIFR